MQDHTARPLLSVHSPGYAVPIYFGTVDPWFNEPGGGLSFNLLKPTGYMLHEQFNIQQL